MTTRFADTRLIPRLPARVEIRKRRTLRKQRVQVGEVHDACGNDTGKDVSISTDNPTPHYMHLRYPVCT